MKLFNSLLSSAIALTLTAGIPAVSTSAFSVETETPPYSKTAEKNETAEKVAEQVREGFRNRSEIIEISVEPGDVYNSIFSDILAIVFEETDNPAEGDYIRTAMSHVHCRYRTNGQSALMTFEVEYNTSAEQEQYVNRRITEILESLNVENLDDYGKLCAIYEYIINNVDYAYDSPDKARFTAYGALRSGKAVCQGYTHLFYRLARECGIPCRMIMGVTAEGNHAGNIAAVDGGYYLFDSTWDVYNSSVKNCDYFMKGSLDFDEADRKNPHIPNGADKKVNEFDIDYTSAEFAQLYPVAQYSYMKNSSAVYGTGDVNNSGTIDSADASLVMNAYSLLSVSGASGLTAPQKKAADVNGDGVIDSKDASAILGYYSYVSTGGKDSIEYFLGR